MPSHITQGQMIIQNENFNIHQKKVVLDGKTRSSKTATRKDGVGFRSRKALNDITNKSCLHNEVSSRKKNLPKEEFNVAEEMFLHDHRKCIEEQQKAKNAFYLDMVLPGHDSVSNAEYPKSKEEKTDVESPRCYDEPVEVPMTGFSDWMHSSTRWFSPPCSPVRWDSPSFSPIAWQSGTVEFILKEETDVCI